MGVYIIQKRYRDRRETMGLFEWKGFVDAENLEEAVTKACSGLARTYKPEVGDMLFVRPNGTGGQGLLVQAVEPTRALEWEPR